MIFSIKKYVNEPLLRAALWTAGGFAASQSLRLLSNLILTRLVQPDAFGLMAIVTVVIVGVEMITDLGINVSIVQNRRGEDRTFLDTAYTLKIARGIAMAAVVAGLAYPLASFYGQPQLTQLLPAVAVMVAISGFGSNAMAMAARRLWLGRATVITILAQLTSTAVAAGCALVWPNVWALIAGYAASTLSLTALSHVVFPGFVDRPGWNSRAAWEIFGFGKWMFLTSILVFAAGQLDRLVLAKFVPLTELGLYSIAFMWAQLPVNAAQTWFGRMMFPMASAEFRSAVPDLGRLKRHRRRFLLAVVAALAILGLAFDTVFHILYPPQYWPATAFFRVLLAGAMVRILDESYRALNLAAGSPHYTAYGSALTIAVFLATLSYFYGQFGTAGVALAYSVSQAGTYVVSAVGARRKSAGDFGFDAVVVGGLALAILAGFSVWGRL
jgi:O-antigen/teichoic acid export membrane protein